MENRTYDILLVEDSEADAKLSDMALRESGISYTLHVVSNGVEALDFLYQIGEYTDKPTPQLVLLDLNLPKVNGREVLSTIKQHPTLRAIPIVVLTNSGAHNDVIDSYRSHANCFILKPVDLDQFYSIIKQIVLFWLKLVVLPEPSD